jgi:murein DD-endopeptidase MepM/ murein hydrolase activator NlpD
MRGPKRFNRFAVVLALSTAAMLLSASVAPAFAATLTGTGDPFPTGAATPSSAVMTVRPPTPGSGGWYWPLNTEKFVDYGHFMQDRGGNWHLAQDMAGTAHQAVYSLGDGVVLESGMVNGFGPGGSVGGAMVILYTTASGKQFKALYGHVEKMRYAKGAKVRAGALIAQLNTYSPPHLHFGIHPGRAYPPDGNPWRGHTYIKSQTYGWVDPVKFLRDNPRINPYVAPAWPVVGSVHASSKPLAAWAASGWMFWTVKTEVAGEATTTTWTTSLPTTAQPSVSATGSPMAPDSVRYRASYTTLPTVVVRVQDRLPRLSLLVSTTRPRVGVAFVSYGRLCNAAGVPFVRAPIVLERWYGGAWKAAAVTSTDRHGRWAANWATVDGRRLRARFAPPNGGKPVYMPAVAPSLWIAPR